MNMNKICGLLTIIILLFSSSCDAQSKRGGRNADSGKEENGQSTVSPPSQNIRDTTPVNVNIYIENSSSMTGYVQGDTEFKSAIGELLVNIKYHYEEKHIHLYYINTEIHPFAEEISSFVAQLSPQTIRVGNQISTNLNNIFQQILNKTDGTTVSILISDCIYSVSGTNTADLLSREKNTVKDAFMTKSKNSRLNLATNIIQLHSKFSGIYYNYKNDGNHRNQLRNKPRPYYICMMGDDGLLSDFDRKIRYAELEGYRNNVYLSAKDYSSGIDYTVLKATMRQGTFRLLKSENGKYYSGIKDPESRGRNFEFRFAVALNLKELPLSGDMLNDTANYMVTKGNFNIENIFNYNETELHANDKIDPVIRNAMKNMTHIIEFGATRRALSSMSFAMKKAVSLPEWIENTNTEDDSNINDRADEQTLGKTFGIKYMIDGIAEAYREIFRTNHPGKALDRYFEIEIPVEN
jgi:hypothetical protein